MRVPGPRRPSAALVGLLADAAVERQLAEQAHAVLLAPCARRRRRRRSCSSWPQFDRRAGSCSRRCRAPARHLLEHLEPLARVEQRDVLRRRDDDGAAHRHALRERELDVAGARRHVDDQVVELAPVGLVSSCLSACVTIGPRQTIGCSSSIRKPIDMTLRPWPRAARSRLPSRDSGVAGRETQHARLARAVDVGVEQPDRAPSPCEREREVDRDGRLAHAALAGGDRDQVPDAPGNGCRPAGRVPDDFPAHGRPRRRPSRPGRARARAPRAPPLRPAGIPRIVRARPRPRRRRARRARSDGLQSFARASRGMGGENPDMRRASRGARSSNLMGPPDSREKRLNEQRRTCDARYILAQTDGGIIARAGHHYVHRRPRALRPVDGFVGAFFGQSSPAARPMNVLTTFQEPRRPAHRRDQRSRDLHGHRKALDKLAKLGPAAIPRIIEALLTRGQAGDRRVRRDPEQPAQTRRPFPSRPRSRTAISAPLGDGLGAVSARTLQRQWLYDLLGKDDARRAGRRGPPGAQKSASTPASCWTDPTPRSRARRPRCFKLIDEIADPRDRPRADSRIDGKDPIVKTHIINVLARFDRPDVNKALQEAAARHNKLVRRAALQGIARAKTPSTSA